MKLEIRSNRDFWAGMMFLVTGSVAIYIAKGYRFGTALKMGPGFFPVILGGILILIGLYVLLTGVRINSKIQGGWSIRAITVLPATLILFGVLMEYAGFLPALLVLIFGSALAGREFNLKEVLLVAALLTLLSVGLFVWGLGLPYPLIKGF